MKPGWHFVAAFSAELEETVVRLGGEGHHALVLPIDTPSGWRGLEAGNDEFSTNEGYFFAYLLTPGLAEAETGQPIYGVYPQAWHSKLAGCVSDRPLMWGGISNLQRKIPEEGRRATEKEKGEFALLPQRAFVPPGTVYVFEQDKLPDKRQLIPTVDSQWKTTFQMLNYGKLLWGKRAK